MSTIGKHESMKDYFCLAINKYQIWVVALLLNINNKIKMREHDLLNRCVCFVKLEFFLSLFPICYVWKNWLFWELVWILHLMQCALRKEYWIRSLPHHLRIWQDKKHQQNWSDGRRLQWSLPFLLHQRYVAQWWIWIHLHFSLTHN